MNLFLMACLRIYTTKSFSDLKASCCLCVGGRWGGGEGFGGGLFKGIVSPVIEQTNSLLILIVSLPVDYMCMT